MAAKKRKRAKKKNPPKRRRRRAVNPPAPKKRRRRRRVAANPAPRRRRRRANPPKKRRRRSNARRRRRNPGWGNLKTAVMGVLAGVGAAIGSAWINDGPLGNSSPTAQNLAVIVEGGIAVYAIDDPVTSACVLLGLVLVPVAGWIYRQAPILAASPNGGGQPARMQPAANGNGGSMSALQSPAHKANIRAVRQMDQQIAALHQGQGVRALHQGMGALHQGMGALHQAYR